MSGPSFPDPRQSPEDSGWRVVAHEAVARHARGSRWPVRFLTGLVLVSVLAVCVVVGVARRSDAAVGPTPVVTVVADSPSEVFTVATGTTADVSGQHGASLWLYYPGAAVPVLAGSGVSTGYQVVIRARLDTTRVPKGGLVDAAIVDDADGSSRAVSVRVLRRSRLMVTHAEFTPSGRVMVSVRATHWSPAGYTGSNLSPVLIQEWDGVKWLPRVTVVTSREGLAGATVTVHGRGLFRALRQPGATVTGATARPVKAYGC